MNKVLLNTDFAEVVHEIDLKIGKIIWKRKPTSEEYKYALSTLLEYSKTADIDNYLADIVNQGVVSPENRKWFETEMLPAAVEHGLKRAGIVFDGNVFKKYYVNMILKVSNKFGLPLKVFTSEEEAKEWFKGKDVAQAV